MAQFGFNGAAVFSYDEANHTISLFSSSVPPGTPQPVSIPEEVTSIALVSLSPLVTTVVFSTVQGLKYYDIASASVKLVENSSTTLTQLQSDPSDSHSFFAVDTTSNSILPFSARGDQIVAGDSLGRISVPSDTYSVGRSFLVYAGQLHPRPPSATPISDLPEGSTVYADAQFIYIRSGTTVKVLNSDATELETVSNVTTVYPELSIVLVIGDSETFWTNRRTYRLPSKLVSIAATFDAIAYLSPEQPVPVILRPRRGLPSFSYSPEATFIFDPTIATFYLNGRTIRTLADSAVITPAGVIAAENGTLFSYSNDGERKRLPHKTGTGPSILKAAGRNVFWLVNRKLVQLHGDYPIADVESFDVESFDVGGGGLAAIVLESDSYRVRLFDSDGVSRPLDVQAAIGAGSSVFIDDQDVFIWDREKRIVHQIGRTSGDEKTVENVTAVWGGPSVVMQNADNELLFVGTQRFAVGRPVLAAQFDGRTLRYWTGLGEPVTADWAPTLTYFGAKLGEWGSVCGAQLSAAAARVSDLLKEAQARNIGVFLKLERLVNGGNVPDRLAREFARILAEVVDELLGDRECDPIFVAYALAIVNSAPDPGAIIRNISQGGLAWDRLVPWLGDDFEEYRR
jgi:hypothetical protein